jgi:hypothetical protein
MIFQTSYTITGRLQRQLAAVATPIVEDWFTDVLIHDTAAVKDMEIEGRIHECFSALNNN